MIRQIIYPSKNYKTFLFYTEAAGLPCQVQNEFTVYYIKSICNPLYHMLQCINDLTVLRFLKSID